MDAVNCELTPAPIRRSVFVLNATGQDDLKESPMVRVLVSTYAAVAVYFLRPYLQRPTVTGVIVSVLWPVALGLTLAWLMMLDDDALRL
jgi:hypothetical protein